MKLGQFVVLATRRGWLNSAESLAGMAARRGVYLGILAVGADLCVRPGSAGNNQGTHAGVPLPTASREGTRGEAALTRATKVITI